MRQAIRYWALLFVPVLAPLAGYAQEAATRTPIVALEQVAPRLALDAADRASLTAPLAALNSELVKLAELHALLKQSGSEHQKPQLHQAILAANAAAQEHRSDILAPLTDEQRQIFQRYLEEQTKRAGFRMMSGAGGKSLPVAGVRKPNERH